VNAVGISPGLAVRGLCAARRHDSADDAAQDDDDGSPRAMRTLCESIKEAFRAVLVPVVHGDACLGTGNDVERWGDDARHSRGGTRIKNEAGYLQ
jgi:hypothetical protein